MRLIDADDLIKELGKYVDYNDDGEQDINSDIVFHTIQEFPTAFDIEKVVDKLNEKVLVERVAASLFGENEFSSMVGAIQNVRKGGK